jgi:hypothetical protein
MFLGRAGDQFVIVIGPGLIILVNIGEIWVVKNL